MPSKGCAVQNWGITLGQLINTDQDRFSAYNTDTISGRQVTKGKKTIN